MGVASLIFGIISIVLSFFPSVMPISSGIIYPFAFLGIIFGALGRKKHSRVATAGFVCSIIGLVLMCLTYMACKACGL